MGRARCLFLIAGLALVFYPLAIYLGLTYWGTRAVAVVLLLAGVIQLIAMKKLKAPVQSAPGRIGLLSAISLVALTALITGSSLGLKTYPVIANLLMLGVFAYSLKHPPSIIERMARLREPNLPPSGVAYTRKVTWVWCGFFVVNGAMAVATIFASDEVWAIYNGVVAYLLMALLFAAEFGVRKWVRRKHQARTDSTICEPSTVVNP